MGALDRGLALEASKERVLSCNKFGNSAVPKKVSGARAVSDRASYI